MTEYKCDTCRWYYRSCCRRNAPTPSGVAYGKSYWPSVDAADFCGEWDDNPDNAAMKPKTPRYGKPRT